MVYWYGPEGFMEVPKHHLPYYESRPEKFPSVRFAQPLREWVDNKAVDPIPRYRRQQDEYLEWYATYNSAGHLDKIAFTVEPPEYWEALALVSRQRLVELYQELVGVQVLEEDLFFQNDLAVAGPSRGGREAWYPLGWKGKYNKLNKWTTTDGIVHLTHRANTLGAEVRLAAEASQVYETDLNEEGKPDPSVIDEIKRIGCAQYGGINRSSDPLIGKGVGRAVASDNRITLTDPIGLYIGSVNIDDLRGPEPDQIIGHEALKVLRGKDDLYEPRILRIEVKLPEGRSFALDQCFIDGRQLKRGGQIARLITLQLYATPYPDSANLETIRRCNGMECRHPDNTDLLINVGNECPAADDLYWLLATPDDGNGTAAPPIATSIVSGDTVTSMGNESIIRAMRAVGTVGRADNVF